MKVLHRSRAAYAENRLAGGGLTPQAENATLEAVAYAILIIVALVLVALLLIVQRRRV
jgi:hypothetical protein